MKIKTIIYIVLALGLGVLVKDYFNQKAENKRNTSNYENSLKELNNELKAKDSTLIEKDNALVEYKFKKNVEFRDYLENTNNQLQGLRNQLSDVNVKLRNVTKVVSSAINYRDTAKTVFNYDSLAQKINVGKDFNIPFKRTGRCITTSGRHIFQNGNFDFIIEETKITDTINIVNHTYRTKHRWLFGIKTNIFGKKKTDTKTFSKCLDPSTIVIDFTRK